MAIRYGSYSLLIDLLLLLFDGTGECCCCYYYCHAFFVLIGVLTGRATSAAYTSINCCYCHALFAVGVLTGMTTSTAYTSSSMA